MCARQAKYRLRGSGFDELPDLVQDGRDESCLSVAAAEGATPLSGFLLGPLENDPDLEKLRALSASGLRGAGLSAGVGGKKIHWFLLATPGGMIVVGDVPSPENLSNDSRSGPLTRRIWKSRKGSLRLDELPGC